MQIPLPMVNLLAINPKKGKTKSVTDLVPCTVQQEDIDAVMRHSFWKPDRYQLVFLKDRVTFSCQLANQVFKSQEQTVFPDRKSAFDRLINPMNNHLQQDGHRLENTGKYINIKCLPGCKFSAWYQYRGKDKMETDIRYFRCIQHTHDLLPHMQKHEQLTGVWEETPVFLLNNRPKKVTQQMQAPSMPHELFAFPGMANPMQPIFFP